MSPPSPLLGVHGVFRGHEGYGSAASFRDATVGDAAATGERRCALANARDAVPDRRRMEYVSGRSALFRCGPSRVAGKDHG